MFSLHSTITYLLRTMHHNVWRMAKTCIGQTAKQISMNGQYSRQEDWADAEKAPEDIGNKDRIEAHGFVDSKTLLNLVCYSRPTVYAYVPNFVSIALFSRPLAAKKAQNFCHILPYAGLRHLVVSPIDKSLTKLHTGAQPQTFPYPMVSKSFLYSLSLIHI